MAIKPRMPARGRNTWEEKISRPYNRKNESDSGGDLGEGEGKNVVIKRECQNRRGGKQAGKRNSFFRESGPYL